MDHIGKFQKVVGKRRENLILTSSEISNNVVKLDLFGLRQEVGLIGELANYTFESWHDDKQQATKKACLEFFDDSRSMVFWSRNYGSGKTFAAAAILNEWVRRDIHRKHPDTGIPCYYQDEGRVMCNGPAWEMTGLFVKLIDFFGHMKSMLDGRAADVAGNISMLQRTPLLIMDDMCRVPPTPFENDIIYRVVDYRSVMGLPFIATTNTAPAQLGTSDWLWGATASRLKLCRFVHLDERDYRGQEIN